MISAVLICKDCGYYPGIISGTMQETIILVFVNTEPANKTFQNFVGTDRYTLIEQSGNNTKLLQTASGFEV